MPAITKSAACCRSLQPLTSTNISPPAATAVAFLCKYNDVSVLARGNNCFQLPSSRAPQTEAQEFFVMEEKK